MSENKERPVFYYMWPFVTSIHCPACDALWKNPEVRLGAASFPPVSRNPENESPTVDSYCPGCGKQLPTLAELHATGCLELPPVHNSPFICGLNELSAFFERTSGHTAQLWKYHMSFSQLASRVYDENSNTHAFVVCLGTRQVVLPRLSFDSTFSLSETGKSQSRILRLKDKASGAVVECHGIGVFDAVSDLW